MSGCDDMHQERRNDVIEFDSGSQSNCVRVTPSARVGGAKGNDGVKRGELQSGVCHGCSCNNMGA